jgi:hypothetical protein
MSSSRRDAPANRAPKWEELERSVERALNAIVDTITGFEALLGGDYAVFEQIEPKAGTLNSGRSHEENRRICLSNIRRRIRSLERENGLGEVPAITNVQFRTVARELQTRQQLISAHVELLLPHKCGTEENKPTERMEHQDLLNENLSVVLKAMFDV